MRSSNSNFTQALEDIIRVLPPRFHEFVQEFCLNILKIAAHPDKLHPLLLQFAQLTVEQAVVPFEFSPYHQAIRTPIDYYQLGLDLISPLIDFQNSSVRGLDHLDAMDVALRKKENVILFANHQIEADPQVISLLLKDGYPSIAENLIFVAGERVTTDPMAIPFSMGRNLLCIYSKKYIDNPPENQLKKQLHNKATMLKMSGLLEQGGHIIYVAPSGGRDRPGPSGKVEVAPFDPQSIEMFYLMARRAKIKTHFHPLALSTFDLMPPPGARQTTLGEKRQLGYFPAHLFFGPAIDMESFIAEDKHALRFLRCSAIFDLVVKQYQDIGNP
ncbi:MAG: 1-acyl-sn-glycerol-3-phosphate acyltransferase [Simkaniaceae bacterium]|nr:1-acyl-sn-glycerol-3-phosphate acyltransferase [Simkaniaceae bacterium]